MRRRDAKAKYVGDSGVDWRDGRLVLGESLILSAAGDGLDAAPDEAHYLFLRPDRSFSYLFTANIIVCL